MNWWIFAAVLAGILAFLYLAQRFRLIDITGRGKPRSSGGGSGLVGIGDEVFAPARHEAAMELDRQTILPAPAPIAGDPDRGVFDPKSASDESADAPKYGGSVTIDLNSPRR
jgi:hypothetical protein